MSFGFEVSNDLNRKVIDGDNSLYVVVPASVTKHWSRWTEYDYYTYEENGVWIHYDRPYKSLEPPMIFMQGNGSHPSEYNRRWPWETNVMWYNEIRYEHIGVPGRWTSAYIGVISGVPRQYVGLVRHYNWDMRLDFMVAGTAVDPGPEGYGAVVYDADGRVVFNSNDNFVEVTGYSNSWTYQGREEIYKAEYFEIWQNSGVTVPTLRYQEWISLIALSRYRRYNGETALVYPINLTRGQKPQIIVRGGRSGSPFHLPLMTVKPKLPLNYTYR